MGRFILTAGHPRALHVPILGEGLLDLRHEVVGVLLVSPFSSRRIRTMVRQRGLTRLIGMMRRQTGAERDEWRQLRERYRFPPASVRRWARSRSVPVKAVPDLNAQSSVRWIRQKSPDAVIYGGGGILRQELIEASGRVLNAHAGPMPEIRGMNAAEWALLLGENPEVTIHLIDGGIDTGPVLHRESYSRAQATLEDLRARAVVAGVRGLLRTVETGVWETTGMRLEDAGRHRQCFVMAPALRELAEARLAGR